MWWHLWSGPRTYSLGNLVFGWTKTAIRPVILVVWLFPFKPVFEHRIPKKSIYCLENMLAELYKILQSKICSFKFPEMGANSSLLGFSWMPLYAMSIEISSGQIITITSSTSLAVAWLARSLSLWTKPEMPRLRSHILILILYVETRPHHYPAVPTWAEPCGDAYLGVGA